MKKLNVFFVIFFLSSLNVMAMSLSEYMSSLGSNSDYSKTKLSSLEIKQIKSNVDEIFDTAVLGTDGIYAGYAPANLRDDYHDIASSLYNDGFLKLNHFEKFEKDYAKLLKTKVPTNVGPKIFWKAQYQEIFNTLLTNLQNDPETCAGTDENATVRKCCQGLAKISVGKGTNARFINFRKKASGQKCDKQSDCQSNLCLKSDLDKPGICVTPKGCFELQTLGGDCSGNKPVCGEGSCTQINKGNLGIGECSSRGNSCSSNSECCSDKCSNNKCVDNFMCLKCVGSGAKPAAGEVCCPGQYLAPNGKCRIIFRPLVPIAPKAQTSFFRIILNNIFIGSAIADSSVVCKGAKLLTASQRSMIETKASECRSKFNQDGGKLADCMRSVDDLQSSFCLDSKKTVQIIDQSEIDTKRAECVQNNAQGSTELKACLDIVKTLENIKKEEGANSEDNRYQEFKSQYNMPMVSAKTYSDVRKCEFRSFNDNWKASSNTERNAELFLRSFEFTFSGSGTQDYWEEQGKGNIFKRANKVALALRKNRARLIERTQAIDKEMTCKCVAIFGPTQFDKSKQDFFTQNCAAEAATLRAKLGTDIDASRGEGGKTAGESNIDGSSISSETDLEKSRARIEEIDKGALGLSHEKLLIEYLDLRSKAQVERFVDDENLEDDLNELSQFISGTDFEEVWKDEVKDDELVRGNPNGDSRLLYKWGFKYLGGLLALILIVVLAVVGGLFTGGALLGILGGALAGFLAGALISAFSGSASPGAFDIKKVKGGKYNLLYKFDGFEKWYVGPKYSNKSGVSETKCDVFAKASTCLKSAYAFSETSMKYLNTLPATGHFIVDPKVPPFVNPTLISTKGMPVYNKTWVQIMNETVEEGVAFLKSTKPSGKVKKGYTITKKSFAKRDIMQEAIDQKYFIPMRGDLSTKDFSFRKEITEAAFKYAMCKSLSEGKCVLAGVDKTSQGLGYLFESEEEAKEWAAYTYEMHYVYSSVTKDTYMGYPLMGADVYFQAVAYNMKLVGSLAASRAQNYAKASSLYQADWDVRARDYQSLGEATLGSTGKSENIKYSPAFFEAFGGLDFAGTTQLEGFDAKMEQGKAGNGFNASELAALTAGRRQAVRVNEAIKDAKKFDETIGKSSEAKQRLVSLSRVGAGLFSNSKNNGNLGSTSTSAGESTGNLGIGVNSQNNDENGAKEGAGVSTTTGESGSGGVTSGIGSGGFGFGNSSSGGSGSSGSYGADYGSQYDSEDGAASSNLDQLQDQGMSAKAADDLISALNKEREGNANGTEDDSIFNVVSRAYKRNYSRVLLRSSDFEKKDIAPAADMMTNEQEAEIKALLETD